jgi:general secretion pathway protein L
MASTLYILLPSKAVAQGSSAWVELARPFALVSEDGTILQQGRQSLASLKNLATNARQVSLLLAASDVTLASVKVPPMAANKLKAALPNLVEDKLLTDPAELIFLSEQPVDGVCTIAVVDRSWMELLHTQCQILGARKLTAHTLSMAMRFSSDAASVILEPEAHVLELALRINGQAGAGLALEYDRSNESPTSAAHQVLQTLSLLAPETSINVSLSGDLLVSYEQAAADDSVFSQQFHFHEIDWKTRLDGLSVSSLNLMSSVSHANQTSFDWAKWRWPLGLAASALIINLIGLNFQWLSMKREARGLNESLTQTYRNTFPKESVILDPIAQMEQKIDLSRKLAGQSTEDDFLVLAAQFGQVWDTVVAGTEPGPSVVSMEYREHKLFVKIKSISLLPIEQFKTSLKGHSLILVSTTDGVLQIRPSKGYQK